LKQEHPLGKKAKKSKCKSVPLSQGGIKAKKRNWGGGGVNKTVSCNLLHVKIKNQKTIKNHQPRARSEGAWELGAMVHQTISIQKAMKKKGQRIELADLRTQSLKQSIGE